MVFSVPPSDTSSSLIHLETTKTSLHRTVRDLAKETRIPMPLFLSYEGIQCRDGELYLMQIFFIQHLLKIYYIQTCSQSSVDDWDTKIRKTIIKYDVVSILIDVSIGAHRAVPSTQKPPDF